MLAANTVKGVLQVQRRANRGQCEALIAEAEKTVNIQQKSKGRIF